MRSISMEYSEYKADLERAYERGMVANSHLLPEALQLIVRFLHKEDVPKKELETWIQEYRDLYSDDSSKPGSFREIKE